MQKRNKSTRGKREADDDTACFMPDPETLNENAHDEQNLKLVPEAHSSSISNRIFCSASVRIAADEATTVSRYKKLLGPRCLAALFPQSSFAFSSCLFWRCFASAVSPNRINSFFSCISYRSKTALCLHVRSLLFSAFSSRVTLVSLI